MSSPPVTILSINNAKSSTNSPLRRSTLRLLSNTRAFARLQALSLRHDGVLGIARGLEAGLEDRPALGRGARENEHAVHDRGRTALAASEPHNPDPLLHTGSGKLKQMLLLAP